MANRNVIAQARNARIESFNQRPHHEPTWVDPRVPQASGFYDQILHMLTVSGWPGLLQISHDADKEDTAEFLGSLHVVELEQGSYIEFHHRSRARRCTYTQLCEVFGWTEGGVIRDTGYVDQSWHLISGHPYVASSNKAKALRDPHMYYLHHILSKTLQAKKNADKVGVLEMSVLISLHLGEQPDWSHYFCTHLSQIRANSPICCGGMVTYLLRRLFDRPSPAGHTILRSTYADQTWFRFGKSIQIHPDGRIEWIYQLNDQERPEPVPRARRGRPPGPGRGRGRQQIVEYGGPAHPPPHPSPPRHEQPPQMPEDQFAYARAHIDQIFHLMRSSFLYGQDISVVPAPPGWFPGQPIPPEYLQPHPPGF